MTDLSAISVYASYKALVVVSPMIFDGDKKDQDRARWFEPGQIACICDGVTSSAHSGKGAELVTSFIPAVFSENILERLRMLCDLLMDYRREAQNCDIKLPSNIPDSMRGFLNNIAKQKLLTSFQTTMVAARFVQTDKLVAVDILKCGDSAFFAFSNNGQLLSSTLTLPSESQNKNDSSDISKSASFVPNKIRFGPEDELLVKVVCRLSENQDLLKKTGISSDSAKNWLICTPLDGLPGKHGYEENLLQDNIISLRPGDQLLVPTFLSGVPSIVNGQKYLNVLYSSTIKQIPSTTPLSPVTNISQHGSTTMVLPDHFYCGYCDYFQDRFPLGTHFILASDGFYGAFSDSQQLWKWLQENKAGLANECEKEEILKQLHTSLGTKGGDDDISFVWVHPNKAKKRKGSKSCRQK